MKLSEKEKTALEHLAQNKMTVNQFCERFGNLVFTNLYQNGLIEPTEQDSNCNNWYLEVA